MLFRSAVEIWLFLLMLERIRGAPCDGTFQDYRMMSAVNSNDGCWFTLQNLPFSVIYIQETTVGILKNQQTTYRMLCRWVELAPETNYVLSFHILYVSANSVNIKVYMNSNISLESNLSAPYVSSLHELQFVAKSQRNKICISGQTIDQYIYDRNEQIEGVFIDNFTVQEQETNEFNEVDFTDSDSNSNNGENRVDNNISNNNISNIGNNNTVKNNNISNTVDNKTVENNISNTVNNNTVENNISNTVDNNNNKTVDNNTVNNNTVNNNSIHNNNTVDNSTVDNTDSIQIMEIFCSSSYLQNLLIFTSANQFQQSVRQSLIQNIIVSLNGIQTQYSTQFNSNYNIQILIPITQSHVSTQFEVSAMGYGKFYHTGQQCYVDEISQKEIVFIQNVNRVSQKFSSGVGSAVNIISSTFCSYFLFNLLNFWNLSLLYCFLQISIIPGFLENLMFTMQQIFLTNGSLLHWFQQIFQFPQQKISFASVIKREKVGKSKNGQKWFGGYGLTSNFVQNNFENCIILGLLLIKILLTIFIFRIFPCFKKYRGTHSHQIVDVFLTETMTLAPFMIIPSLHQIMSLNYVTCPEKINIALNTFFLFICFLIPSVKYLSCISSQHDKSSIALISLFSQFLTITTSSFISFNNLLFLMINFAVLIIKTIIIIRKWRNLPKEFRVFCSIGHAVWCLHHLIFLVFYILDQFANKKLIVVWRVVEISKILALIEIFVLIVGTCVEIFRFFYDICKAIILVVKKKCRKSNQVRDHEIQYQYNGNISKQLKIQRTLTLKYKMKHLTKLEKNKKTNDFDLGLATIDRSVLQRKVTSHDKNLTKKARKIMKKNEKVKCYRSRKIRRKGKHEEEKEDFE